MSEQKPTRCPYHSSYKPMPCILVYDHEGLCRTSKGGRFSSGYIPTQRTHSEPTTAPLKQYTNTTKHKPYRVTQEDLKALENVLRCLGGYWLQEEKSAWEVLARIKSGMEKPSDE